MTRGFAWAALTAAFCLAFAPTAGAATQTQTRTCPIPVVGGDPDVVQLSGPVGTTWTVTADESPGEPSHVVAIAVRVTSSDGSGPILRQSAAVGMSPVSVTLDLAPGHHYTLDWLATFDYGVHPCASILPGQSAFQIDT